MRPRFNSNPYNPNNNQLPLNGANNPSTQQVLGNRGTFFPNPPQINPQFQMGLPGNPQLVVPPFGNPNNALVNPNQLLSLLQSLGTSTLPQLLAQNALNQFNGQLGVPNIVQSVNNLLGMQMPNFAGPSAGPFMMNAPSGLPNVGGFAQQGGPPNIAAANSGSFHNLPNRSNVFPGAVNTERNATAVGGAHNPKANWRNPHNKNFTGNLKHDASRTGFNKKQFHNRQNAPGTFRSNDANPLQVGKHDGMASFKASSEKAQVQKKRSLALTYTPKEIQQWREERRKNYPSAANVDKKLKRDTTQVEDADEVAKARRQQLKEILSKQAELGFEVPEIPSHYLSDSEKPPNAKQQNNRGLGKRGKFQNKFDNRRGKFQKNDRFATRQRFQNNNPTQNQRNHTAGGQNFANGSTEITKKEPSLLKKLLSNDVRRDKKHLLQAFRFMVMNSFFQNFPDKTLKYPAIIVQEQGSEVNDNIEAKTQVTIHDEQSTKEKVPSTSEFNDDFNCGDADNSDSKNMVGFNGSVEGATNTTDEEDESSEDGEITD